jgi:hypothetical protein
MAVAGRWQSRLPKLVSPTRRFPTFSVVTGGLVHQIMLSASAAFHVRSEGLLVIRDCYRLLHRFQ